MGESGGATYQDLFGSDEEDDEVQARPAAPEAEAEAGEEAAAGPDEGAEEEGAADQDGEGGGEAEAEAKADAVGEGGADDDLFGEREEEAADVIEEEDERAAARTSRQDLLVDDIPRAPPLHLSIPQLPRPKPGRLCYARLPNILGVEARPFDANSYDPDEEAKRGTVRENVVRWRYGQNSAGEAARESNTRLVRWSDGSLTLHVGAEVLLATEQPLHQEHAHVFAKHAGLIECHGVLSHRIHFQPATRDSLTHQKLVSKQLQSSKQPKERKIRMTTTLSDPEKAKEAMERLEEQKNKLMMSQERAGMQFGGGGASGRWDEDFLEGGEGEGEGDLGAIRAQITGRKRKSSGGGSRVRRPQPRRSSGGGVRRASGSGKKGKKSADDDDDEGEAKDSDEEAGSDEMEGFIVDDEEDEAGNEEEEDDDE